MSDERLEQLRVAFDGSFAQPAMTDETALVDLLALRVGGAGYAMRVADIASLASDRKIVAVPTPIDEALGIAGIRGVVVPVYSLAVLLGHARPIASPRWLVVSAGPEPLAMAFDELDGFHRLPASALVPSSTPAPHLSHTVRIAGHHLAIVELHSIARRLTQEP